jgi:hypothetical protein
MSSNRRPAAAFAAVLLAGAATAASAADISWSTGPTFGGATGHEGILTNGTLVEAVSLRGVGSGSVVVDPLGLNITFQIVDSAAFSRSWPSATGGGAADPGWASVLANFEWQQSANVSAPSFLSGLTVGNTYQVQFFAARSDCCATRTSSYGDGNGNVSAAVTHGSYTSVVGTFVADAASQRIDFIDSSTNPILNAYVLRDLTAPIPEPGTWAMFVGGLALLGAALRRRPEQG